MSRLMMTSLVMATTQPNTLSGVMPDRMNNLVSMAHC